MRNDFILVSLKRSHATHAVFLSINVNTTGSPLPISLYRLSNSAQLTTLRPKDGGAEHFINT